MHAKEGQQYTRKHSDHQYDHVAKGLATIEEPLSKAYGGQHKVVSSTAEAKFIMHSTSTVLRPLWLSAVGNRGRLQKAPVNNTPSSTQEWLLYLSSTEGSDVC